MKRGEIWWTDLAHSDGGEIQKRRPAIIVSNNQANRYANRVQIIPLTSNVDKIYPCDAGVMVKDKPSKAMADQLTTVSKKRLSKRIGVISDREMRALEYAMRLQLHLAR